MSEEREITRRQQIAEMLEGGEWSFEDLRGELNLPVHVLKEDLRHILRSHRRRLRLTPPRCAACGFVFRGREARHLHPPGRCPRCRERRIEGPWFVLT